MPGAVPGAENTMRCRVWLYRLCTAQFQVSVHTLTYVNEPHMPELFMCTACMATQSALSTLYSNHPTIIY